MRNTKIFPAFAPKALVALIVLQCAFTLSLTLMRYWGGMGQLLDNGQVEQALYNVLATGVPTITTQGYAVHLLGFHFSPLVLALAPLYQLWPQGEVLLVVQSFCIAIAAWPIYLTLKRIGASDTERLLFAALYLFNPFTLNAALLWDFHEQALAVPLVACGLYALVARKRGWFLLTMLLLLGCKEQYGLTVAGFGAAWGLYHRTAKFGWLVMLAGFAAFYVVNAIAMPELRLGIADEVRSRYAWLSENPASFRAVLRFIFSDAGKGWSYLFLLPAAFLFLPCMARRRLLVACLLPLLGEFIINMLSANPMPRSMFSYHSMTLIPALAVAAWGGYDHATRWIPPARIKLYLLASFVVFNLLAGPIPFMKTRHPFSLTHGLTLERDHTINTVQAQLPPGVKVSAQANAGVLVAARPWIQEFPAGLAQADAVLIRLQSPLPLYDNRGFNSPWFGNSLNRQNLMMLQGLLRGNAFGIVLWQENWLVLRRGANDTSPQARGEIKRRIAELQQTAKP